MRQYLIYLLGIADLLTTSAPRISAQERIFINEIMPSNVDGIMDDLFNFPDSWIELFNADDQEINLKGWFLSNDKDDLTLWEIPVDCKIASKSYKIIYCDKEDKNLHANFRIDIKGEKLFLTKPDGVTIVNESPKFDKLPPNNAFGRSKDGTDSWGWMHTPTPGKSNNQSELIDKEKIVPTITFSYKGGVYDSPFEVKLSAKDNAFSEYIFYTTDGTEPNASSIHYEAPITIDTTTILKARIIREGYLSRPSNAASYLFPDHELALPVMSLSIDPDYLWDDTIGMYTDGKNGANFENKYVNWAQDWRRPVNIEYYINGEQKINQLGEMRIHGGKSKEKPQKSWAIYANKRFGEKRFDYSFFAEKEPLDDGYKSILLRNSGQDFNRSFIGDAVNQYLMGGIKNLDYQAYQPTITFINGEYWGIYNIRERSNDDFVASNYDTEDIDMLENFDELKNGTREHFDAFYQLVKSGNLTYQELDKYLDIDESLNFFILETFVANNDWPNNNNVCWRERDGGKWRWLLKDTDYGTDFASTNFNAFEYIDKENFGQKILSSIIKACWKDETFKKQFIDRYCVYLGDIFHKDVTTALVDSFANQINEEMKYARPRWQVPPFEYMTYEYWQKCIKNKRDWFRSRPDKVYQHLQQFFKLDKPVAVNISTDLPDNTGKQLIQINNTPVEQTSFRGKFFGNRTMSISLKNTTETENFKGWLLKSTDNQGKEASQIITDKEFSFYADTTVSRYDIQAFIKNDLPDDNVGIDPILRNRKLEITVLKNGINIQSEVSMLLPIHTIDGKLFKNVQIPAGSIQITLPQGLYVINRKIIDIL